MISCSDAVRRLWEYLEGELDAEDRERIDEHLGACLRCCGEAEFAGVLRRFLADHGADDPLPEPVRRRLLASLDGMEGAS